MRAIGTLRKTNRGFRANTAVFALAALVGLCAAVPAFAVEFKAEADREEIAQDESVSVKLTVEADGTVPVESPQFDAPGFDEIQNYQGSFVQSYYDSNAGKFSAKFSRSFTYVLRPKNTGRLAITNIRVKVDGQTYTAGPITVIVTGGGAGTPPPRGYGGAGAGLRGAAKKGRGTVLFLRTEVDKTKVYKGQQIVVNYYLYSRARNFNATADRYPSLNGFLKEELDIPVLTGRLEAQDVVLDGTAYRRVLIASFAAYPLKEGKLTIDPMEVKATYMADRGAGGPQGGGMFDDEDDLFQQFFRMAQPQQENLRSESVSIDVGALPAVPKDLNYTGAVGDFEVIAAADRTDVKAHEAVTLTLKIEGKGNISNIETPKIPLPDGFELYEAKSQTKGKAGVGEKVFEYLLIPRKAGDFTLPRIELGFFDPKKGEYVRKATDPIRIHVNEGDPGAENQPPARLDPTKEMASPVKESKRIFDLFTGDGPTPENGTAFDRVRGRGPWKLVLALILAGAVLLALLIRFRTEIRNAIATFGAKSRRKGRQDREWAKVRRQSEEAGRLPFNEILKCFDFLESELEDALSERFGIKARGFTREQLKAALVGQGLIEQNLWQRLSELLEFTETLRFASKAGAVSEERARNELRKWISECEAILGALSKADPKKVENRKDQGESRQAREI